MHNCIRALEHVSFYPEISNTYKCYFKGEACFIDDQTKMRYETKGRFLLIQQNLKERLKVSELRSLCMANYAIEIETNYYLIVLITSLHIECLRNSTH